MTIDAKGLAEALRKPLPDPLPERFGTTASAGAALEHRIRCYAPGCGAWHTTRHAVDGLEVLSVYCAEHARDEHRAIWMTYPAGLDPRSELLRFLPHHVPAARAHLLVVAAKQRQDLRSPPEPPAGWHRSGDARVDYVALAAPPGGCGAATIGSDPTEG